MDERINVHKNVNPQSVRGDAMRGAPVRGRRPMSGSAVQSQGTQYGGTNHMNTKNVVGSSGAARSLVDKSLIKSEKTINIFDKIITVCVFMLFFGLPLFFLNLTYQGINFEKQYYFYFWTFFGVVALIARGMLGGKVEIRRTTLDIPLGILWIVAVISTIFSVDKYHSVFGFFGNPVSGLISITALILAYYLIVSYVSKKRAVIMWWAIVLNGSIVVLWSFLATMRLTPSGLLQFISPSLTGSFTGLSVFLGMMLPIFLVSFSILSGDTRKNLRSKIVGGILVVIVLLDVFTLSVLHGYVWWYVILGALGLLLVFTISHLVKVSQKTIVMTIIIFLLMFFFWLWGQPIITRTQIQPEASMKYSLSFDIAKEAIKNKPLFGSGLGTYGYNFSLYRPKDLNKTGQYDVRFYSDRGILMESISTIGIIGVIVLMIMFLTYISTAIHAFLRSKDDEVKTISLGLFVASVIALLYALVGAVDGMIILYGVLIAALMIGLLRGSLGENDEKLSLSMTSSPQYALSFAFLSILVAVGVIFGFVTLGKMFVADVYAGSALKARGVDDFTRSTDLFEKAIVLNGQEGRYFTVIGQYGLDLANVELAKPDGERNDEFVAQFIGGATGAASTGKELMPNDVFANETRGFVFENSGGYVARALEIAMDAYTRASDLEPQNPYLNIAIGKLKLVEAQSKSEDAVEEKTQLINDAKTYFISAKDKTTFDYEGQNISLFAPAHYYLSVVEEALGNIDGAINAMATALQVTGFVGGDNQQQVLSRQINYGFNLARLLQKRGTEDDMKNAENILLQIIGVNDQEVNSHLSLGLLYEKQGKRDEAVIEYKKILTLLPEGDATAKENIQNLIDTVEQGGSNLDPKNQDGNQEDQTSSQTENIDVAVKEPEKTVSVLVVRDATSGDTAQQGQAILAKEGYEADIREEDTQSYDGIVLVYSGDADRAEVQAIESALRVKFDTVRSERSDEKVSVYNHDVVVFVGSANDE